jgi:hypothetical protein
MRTFCFLLISLGTMLGQSAPITLKVYPTDIYATNTSNKSVSFVTFRSKTAGMHADEKTEHPLDFLFRSLIPPGASLKVAGSNTVGLTQRINGGPEQPYIMPPYESATLVFVEFSDGTTWGTPDDFTNQQLALRKPKVDFYNRVLAAFDTGGQASFTSALKDEVQTGIRQLRGEARMLLTVQEDSGTQAAVTRVQGKLATVQDHMNLVK